MVENFGDLSIIESLCYVVLAAKYFPDGDRFHPKAVDKPSYAWSSLCAFNRSLRAGFGWQVGDGHTINIKKHQWGFEGLNGSSFITNPNKVRWQSVRDLWLSNELFWDKDRVINLYGPVMGNRICELPIVKEGLADRIVWFHDHQGVYSTKSGYSWLSLHKIGYNPHRNFWRILWKLKLPPKVRIFLWRVSHNLLPTNAKIAAINPAFNSLCPKCGVDVETLMHALRDCGKTRDVLTHGGVDGRILSSEWNTGIDWLESVIRFLDKPAFKCFNLVLWNIWNDRNNMLFKGHMDEPKIVWHRAVQFCND